MFRHDAVTGKPTDVKIFDLQIIRYAPPSRDLLHFIYCLNPTFRKEHEKEVHLAILRCFEGQNFPHLKKVEYD
jgi:hypothetical protein